MSGGPQFTKWEDNVRKGGVLTYDIGSTASGWSTAISTAKDRFNDLSSSLGLKVTLKPVDPKERASANILVAAVSSSYSFDRGGTSPGTGSLDPDGNSGATEFWATTGGLVRAYVFLPLNSTNSEFMKTCMAVHEFFHATGLHEHSDMSRGDIMVPVLTPRGTDKVEAGGRVMPPIWMSNETGAKIANCWS